jgi:glycine cleavage system H protein
VAKVQQYDFPDQLLYDLQNQIWYERLADDTLRVGFTPLAMALAGDVLVFTPKRIGRDFETGRSFATIECGKWVGSARAAFNGIVVAHNEQLVQKPELLNSDAFASGWMLIVRPAGENWGDSLITGPMIADVFEKWLVDAAYKDRTS